MAIRMLRRRRKLRQSFRRELAKQTPLIDGPETEAIARSIRYSPARAREIIDGNVVPFDPRETFPTRLMQALE